MWYQAYHSLFNVNKHRSADQILLDCVEAPLFCMKKIHIIVAPLLILTFCDYCEQVPFMFTLVTTPSKVAMKKKMQRLVECL